MRPIQHLAFLLLAALPLAFAPSFAAGEERPDRIIADFEADSYGAWQTTGDAFGDGPASGTLDRQQTVTRFVGKRLVNSFRHGDVSTGSLTSPELFELAVDGDPEKTRWVTFAADAKYVIGDFDGRKFTPAHDGKQQVDYGKYYASQTFENAPHGRRIQSGWAQLAMPDMPFNQAFSFPHELTLRTSSDGIRMLAKPIHELEKLHAKKYAAEPQLITPDHPVSLNVAGVTCEIRATFEVGAAKELGINVAGNEIEYNAFRNELNGAALESVDGMIKLQILVDRPMIEICGNDGELFITSDRSNIENLEIINAFVRGGAVRLVEFEVFELKSIWP